MTHSAFEKIIGLAVFASLTLSCSLLENAISQGTGTRSVESAGTPQAAADPRVQKTLSLRSVQMELETAFPGKDPARTLISIDADGNQRIEMTLPAPEGAEAPDSPDANTLEIFIIGGAAYSRIGKEGQAESSPEQIDALHRILYNPSGPGLWLILLPESSFTSEGNEARGGFQTTRFSVNGAVEEGTIRGQIWEDTQTKALVGADLEISESLFYAPDTGHTGTVTIRLTVEKSDVPPITLP